MLPKASFLLKPAFKKMVLLYFVVALMAGFTLMNETHPAHAAGIVSSCTPGGLASALQGGGLVTFNCDGVIDLPSPASINGNTALDATGHNVTLRGPQLFKVLPGRTLSLIHLTLADGGNTLLWPVFYGGAIYNKGNLITLGVTFQNNHSYINGGAIYNEGGSVQINNSIFTGNKATGQGGAIFTSGGVVSIYGSTFDKNQGGWGGGAIYSSESSLDISQSLFTGNKALNGPANGGTVSNGQTYNGGAIFSTGKLKVYLSRFESNIVNNGAGGAIFAAGPTLISNAVFKWNGALKHSIGGAIYNKSADFLMDNSYVWANSANKGGGFFNANHAIVSKTTFNYNSADNGGAFYNDGGDGNSVRVLNSTFTANQASQQGGGIYNGVGGMTIINSTFSGNSAYLSSKAGASIYRAFQNGFGVDVYNTILNTPQGGQNCGGQPIGNGGSNIQYPGTSCGQNIVSTNPLLAALADNGGPTLTMALLPGSPAINSGNNFVCTALPMDGKDQRGVSRLVSGNCDIGAYEVGPSTKQAPNSQK